ncbi:MULTISPECIES: hypothetical protein [unclassified Nocardiopsis]|uniref:hypothetical protein n=1 Tax=Nocardiopsis TaxID=2013 RepID=UPI00387ABAF1
MDPAAELAAAATTAGFATAIEAPDRVDLHGVMPDGSLHGAMRFHLATQAGEHLWRYEFPARTDINTPGPGQHFNNFPRHPTPADFHRLGYWWRHLPTGPTWTYQPPTWMRPHTPIPDTGPVTGRPRPRS